jgi:hypothetical protein
VFRLKTGRIKRGTVAFSTASTNHYVRDGAVIHSARQSYTGQIEYFGVYCFDNDKCYLIPVDDIGKTGGFLRIDETKNNQKKNIHWAKDYEM